VYFNVVLMLALFELYWTTGSQVLLLAVALQHLLVVQQFLPFLRLDGYYIVSDLLGVPDLFSYVRPIMAGLVPGRPIHARLAQLRPRIRVLVAIWVLATVEVVLTTLALLAIRLPHSVSALVRFASLEAT